MNLNCNNKGCNKDGEHKLDVDTNEVLCEFCGKVISTITEPMKRILKSCGQVIRSTHKKSFMFPCLNCKANREILLEETTNNCLCKVCHQEIKVQPAMKQAMMELAKLKDE